MERAAALCREGKIELKRLYSDRYENEIAVWCSMYSRGDGFLERRLCVTEHYRIANHSTRMNLPSVTSEPESVAHLNVNAVADTVLTWQAERECIISWFVVRNTRGVEEKGVGKVTVL
jgi:hypothetical protein